MPTILLGVDNYRTYSLVPILNTVLAKSGWTSSFKMMVCTTRNWNNFLSTYKMWYGNSLFGINIIIAVHHHQYVTSADLVHKQKICSKKVANLKKPLIAQMGRLCTNSLVQQIKYPLLFHFGFFALSLFLLLRKVDSHQ